MNYPTRPIVQPSSLQCAANGQLQSTLLTTIGIGGRLERTAARAWAALYVAAAADGWTDDRALTWTPGGTYRTLAQQEAGFRDRWQTTPPDGGLPPVTTFYNGGTWWLRTYRGSDGRWRYVARSARPGTSNHGLGLAVDVALGPDMNNADPLTPDALTWLRGNAISLGWSWEPATLTPQEPWHLHYYAGDQLPERVLQIEAFLSAQQGRG